MLPLYQATTSATAWGLARVAFSLNTTLTDDRSRAAARFDFLRPGDSNGDAIVCRWGDTKEGNFRLNIIDGGFTDTGEQIIEHVQKHFEAHEPGERTIATRECGRPTGHTEQEHREVEKYHETAHRALCVQAVTRWNALMERRHKPRWSPMIGVAITAEFYWLDVFCFFYWLDVFCFGCRQIKQVDLRPLDRHAQTTLYGLIPMLSCRSCQPSPPFAQLLRLSERECQSLNAPAYIPPKRGISRKPRLPNLLCQIPVT